jgi:ribosomal protein S24E
LQLKQDKMEAVKIIEERENNVMKRKEIILEIHAPKIPSKEECLDLIAKKFSVEKEVIAIERILGKFGCSLVSISAKIYFSPQDKEKIEPKQKKKKSEAPKEAAK